MNLIQADTRYGKVWISADDHHVSDLSVIEEIFTRDAYRVQQLHSDGFNPEIIFDIGMNHGLFSFLCGKLWPDARIFAFEPQISYLRHGMLNLLDTVKPICLPVFGYGADFAGELHADQNFWKQSGQCLDTNAIVRMANESVNVLLKCDAEGAEANIFRALKPEIDLFDVVTGEWHFPRARDAVAESLEATHSVDITEEGECGHFFARLK